jgi:site-specific recombinase XerD
MAAQCAEIMRIPTKRTPIPAPCYLDPSEVEAILAQPDRLTLEGQRDQALLSFLYNSGAPHPGSAQSLFAGDPF